MYGFKNSIVNGMLHHTIIWTKSIRAMVCRPGKCVFLWTT